MPILTTEEQLMSDEQLIYSWLKQGRISCEEIINQYANTIRAERDIARHEALSYTYPLYLMQEKAKLKPKEECIPISVIQNKLEQNKAKTDCRYCNNACDSYAVCTVLQELLEERNK